MDSIDKTISKHMLKKFGWALEDFNHATPVTSHFVYFKDWRVNKIWLTSLSQDNNYISFKQANWGCEQQPRFLSLSSRLPQLTNSRQTGHCLRVN